MKLEAVKSIVLTALILFSIMFTISIWNYQPSYKALDEPAFTDPQLNGEEETKKGIIDPQKIIFHLNDQHLRLQDASAEESFYAHIQSLSLFDFEPVTENVEAEEGERVELLFPLALSGRTLMDIFTIEEEDVPNEGLFDKISISLDNGSEFSQVEFIDTANNQQFTAHIRKNEVEKLMGNYDDPDTFQEQVIFYGKNDLPIYLPAEEPELSERYFSVNLFSETSELEPLVNVLFSDITAVYQNSIAGGEQYTDGLKEIKVFDNYMEFVDPLAKYSEMDKWNLIDQSLNFINDHHGWTSGTEDEFQLEDVNVSNNTIIYRMYFQNYPVVDEYNHLATIELTMHNQSVYKYSRPLLQLRDDLAPQEENIEIGSGSYVISLIEENKELAADMIEDISIGYKLTDQQGSVQLVPGWYYKDNSGWKEIPVPDTVEGGA